MKSFSSRCVTRHAVGSIGRRLFAVIGGVLFAASLALGLTAEATAAVAIDLADVVGGGNGTGTGASRGIDPRDGSIQTVQAGSLPGVIPNVFHSVPAYPFVDGVFVPDGIVGGVDASIPVSSTGLTVTGIADGGPTGIDSYSWDYIWNGFNLQSEGPTTSATRIGMHANKGITFDLRAIAAANPGLQATAFSTIAQITSDPTVTPSVVLGSLWAYVIVDGTIVDATFLDAGTPSKSVSISIAPTSRFLTLLTSSNGGYGSDQAIFGDARLTLTNAPPAAIPVFPNDIVALLIMGAGISALALVILRNGAQSPSRTR
jgi:hypothetical protein